MKIILQINLTVHVESDIYKLYSSSDINEFIYESLSLDDDAVVEVRDIGID